MMPNGETPTQTLAERAPPRTGWFSTTLDVVLVAAATALAAALRWYDLDAIPPGFYHDEAINGLAGLDIRQGRLFLLYGFDVREPLFHWLVAAAQLLWGDSVTSVRGAAALTGTLTVPAVYLLGARLFNRWVGITAAFGLAISLWHLSLSRFGVRGVTLPLLLTITCYLLWRGLESGRRGTFILAGLFLGLTGYTYISSRAVPLLVAAFVLWQAMHQRQVLRARAGGYLLALLAAAAVFSPLGYTFLRSPELFVARSDGVSLLAAAEAPRAIGASAAHTLGMFVLAGDANLRHNLDGRPVLDLLGAAFMAVGIVVAARRCRRPAYALCLIWLPAMLLPGVLSIDSPHNIRTLGAAPAVYLLAALGIVHVGSVLPTSLARHCYGAAIALWLAWSTFATAQSYFHVWASDPAVAAAYEANLSEPARHLAELPPAPAVAFFSEGYAGDYRQVLEYLGRRKVPAVQWHDGNGTMVLPQGSAGQTLAPETIMVILGRNPNAERMLTFAPEVRLLRDSAKSSEEAPFSIYQATEAVRLWPAAGRPAAFVAAGAAMIMGIGRVEGRTATPEAEGEPWLDSVTPGDTLALKVFWQVLRPAAQSDLRMFYHLVDVHGQRWAGQDVRGYPSSAWRGGEQLVTWVELPVPVNAPPGKYELRAGAYSYATKLPLTVADQNGQALGGSAALAGIKVPGMRTATTPGRYSGATLAGGPSLFGYDLARESEDLLVTLFWKPRGRIGGDYTVFVHLVDARGKIIAQHDGPPAGGAFPTSYWAPGEVIRDAHTVPLPPELPSGTYQLWVGMYEARSGRRLPNGAGGDALPVGTVVLP